MAIFDLYSTRKRRASADDGDVYNYDKVPVALRVQFQQIIMDALGPYHKYTNYDFDRAVENNEAWNYLNKTLCRELGTHRLTQSASTPLEDVMNFIGQAEKADDFLDASELAAKYIDLIMTSKQPYEREKLGAIQGAEQAIDEINHRMRSAGFGYQYLSGAMVRVDSQYLHSEAVKPAISLLATKGFEGAEVEFLEAHRHYRLGEYKDAVTWANKSFESTMKAICTKKRWKIDPGARASDLLKVLKREKLWPEYLDASFEQLISTLKSGLPQVRNEAGAHGDGIEPKNTPPYVAGYALHLAAAKILLMIEAADL